VWYEPAVVSVIPAPTLEGPMTISGDPNEWPRPIIGDSRLVPTVAKHIVVTGHFSEYKEQVVLKTTIR